GGRDSECIALLRCIGSIVASASEIASGIEAEIRQFSRRGAKAQRILGEPATFPKIDCPLCASAPLREHDSHRGVARASPQLSVHESERPVSAIVGLPFTRVSFKVQRRFWMASVVRNEMHP